MVHLTLCLALQALADSNTPTVQLRGPSQDSELGMTGGRPACRASVHVFAGTPVLTTLQDPTGYILVSYRVLHLLHSLRSLLTGPECFCL